MLSRFPISRVGVLLTVIALAVIAVASLWSVASQAQSGVVRGRVLDEAGRPVAGARGKRRRVRR